jgi:hypothetical protein
VCKIFHLFELENLCVNCTKEKKTLYTDFILVSHFILRFGETSVQFGGTLQITLMLGYTRVIRKVRNTQQQNPEFGHTQGEIKKKTCKIVH